MPPRTDAVVRTPLTRDLVLRTAMELVDAHGLDALSMRKLGQALGVEAMSLYNHVANKPDLLDAIVDLAVGEIWVPAPGDAWRPAMRRRAVSAREMLARHPWALGLIDSSASPSAARLRYPEAVIGCLREAGFSVAMAVHAFNALDSYVYGFVLQERSLPFGSSTEFTSLGADMTRELAGGAFPHLGEVVTELMGSGYDYADEFAFGLELILDGLERAVAAAAVTSGSRRSTTS